MSKNEVILRSPFDAHVHVRQGEMASKVIHYTDRQFAWALLMPNTVPPLDTPRAFTEYTQEIGPQFKTCKPLYTFKITSNVTPEDVLAFKARGAVAGKLYPDGVTTNSAGTGLGRRMFETPFDMSSEMRACFTAMQEADLILSLHGEIPGADMMSAESEFLAWVSWMLYQFPRLRVILEHISTAAAVSLVRREAKLHSRLAATVTLHHMLLTVDDVLGDSRHFCKPVCKTRWDRDAICGLVFEGHPLAFCGSDSAPHAKAHKLPQTGKRAHAGVFSAPYLLQMLAEVFEDGSALERLPDFVCRFGADFYRLTRSAMDREVVLRPAGPIHEIVQDELDGLIPFRAGQVLKWTCV